MILGRFLCWLGLHRPVTGYRTSLGTSNCMIRTYRVVMCERALCSWGKRLK